MYKLRRNIRIVSYDLAGEQLFPGRSLGTSPVRGTGFRLVVPKCARLQRLRRAAGCFGEIAATPNPGRGLRFLVSRAENCHWPHPHPKAAVQNRGLTACNRTAGSVRFGTSPAVVIVALGNFAPCGERPETLSLDSASL